MTNLLADIWMPATEDLWRLSPELILIGTIVAILLIPIVFGRSTQLSAGISLVGCLATLLLTAMLRNRVFDGGVGGMSPPHHPPMLLLDNFAIFFKIFLMLFLALVIFLWMIGNSLRKQEVRTTGESGRTAETAPANGPEFFVLLLASALGMVLMVGTLNLLVMLIAMEMASLPSYAIVAGNKRSRLGAEASLKYVVFGAAAAAVMTYGLSLLFGCFGTLDVPTIVTSVAANPSGVGLIGWIGLSAFCVGIAFKISAVPFHFWCPDVFQGAPIEITTWLSVASKGAGLGLLLRIVSVLSSSGQLTGLMAPFAWGIGLVAAATCTVGNLAAYRQDSVKRILAYSSIAHAGYMMMAAAIFTQPVGERALNIGLAAITAYLLIYMIMNLGAFSVTAMVAWQTGSDNLSVFAGLGRRSPGLALPMAVCLFSLIGLPPLGGFAAKWWLLVALGKAADHQPWLWSLVLVAVGNTAISLYYYLRIVRQMYLIEDEKQPAVSAPISGLAMVNLCAIALLLLGTVLFNSLGDRAAGFASNLFNGLSMISPPRHKDTKKIATTNESFEWNPPYFVSWCLGGSTASGLSPPSVVQNPMECPGDEKIVANSEKTLGVPPTWYTGGLSPG